MASNDDAGASVALKSAHRAEPGLESTVVRLDPVVRVQNPTGTEVARVTKTWARWAKERFTKADNYVVEMHRPLEEPLRSLVVAAALAIDFELKEWGDQTRGSSGSRTRRYE